MDNFSKLPDDVIEKIIKMKLKSELLDEYWIDLYTLVEYATVAPNGLVDFFYQFDSEMPEIRPNATYHLRLALRKVGKKITKIERYIDNDFIIKHETFYTDITEDEWTKATTMSNLWTDKITEKQHEIDDYEENN